MVSKLQLHVCCGYPQTLLEVISSCVLASGQWRHLPPVGSPIPGDMLNHIMQSVEVLGCLGLEEVMGYEQFG